MIIDGPKRQRSGGPEQRKETQDDQEQDRKMTSRNWQVPSGLCPEMNSVIQLYTDDDYDDE